MDISVIVASCKFGIACNFLFIWLHFRMSSVCFSLRHKLFAVRYGHKVSNAVVFKRGFADHR